MKRRHVWEGKVYLIRDNIASVRLRNLGAHKVEYAKRGRKGKKIWRPTIEGVRFADISPYEVIK